MAQLIEEPTRVARTSAILGVTFARKVLPHPQGIKAACRIC